MKATQKGVRLLCLLTLVFFLTLAVSVNALAADSDIVFKVTVPSVLPVVADHEGNITVAQDAKIVNSSSGAVKISAISVVPQNSWKLNAWEMSYLKTPVNTKSFAMRIGGNNVPASGAISVSGIPAIAKGSSMALTYDAKIAVQSRNISETIANVVFTVSWNGRGPLAGISVSTAPTKTAYYDGDAFDSTGMKVTASFADGTSIGVAGWKVTNGSSLTVGQKSVTVSYTSGGITRTAEVPITVTKKPAYALVYDTNSDGVGDKLVFQRGNTANSTYTLIASYTGFEDNAYTASSVPWYSQRSNITNVSFADAIQPKATAYWFKSFSKLTSVTGISNLDTSQVTTMYGMFDSASKLTSLDLSSWDTSQVATMSFMFYGCTSLKSLNLSGLDTRTVNALSYTFYNCKGLTTLDLSSFNTAKVTSMSYLFSGCTGLKTLKLSGWKNTATTTMASMFNNCSSLVTIYADSTFSTSAVTTSTNMFNGCTSLVGGCGTAFTTDYKDKTYARIDIYGRKGYFTKTGCAPFVGTIAIGERVGIATLRMNGVVVNTQNDGSKGSAVDYIDGATLTFGASDGVNNINWIKVSDTMLIADRNLLDNISWNRLKELGYVTGKNVRVDGVLYKIRLITGGPTTYEKNDSEWYQYIVNGPAGNSNDVWHFSYYFSWCKDVYSVSDSMAVVRGYYAVDTWSTMMPINAYEGCGFRPALEIVSTSATTSSASVPSLMSVEEPVAALETDYDTQISDEQEEIAVAEPETEAEVEAEAETEIETETETEIILPVMNTEQAAIPATTSDLFYDENRTFEKY